MSHLQFDDQERELRVALIAAWTPKEKLPVSVFASQHLYLSAEYSREVGYVNLDRYPFLTEIMDRLGTDDPIRTVAFRAGIQSGKTLVGQAFLTSVIGAMQGPFLWVTDTDGKAEIFSKKRLDLMIRDDPLLKSLVASSTSRTKDNTIKFKTFPGGDIKLVGAQSVTGLTSDTCRFVMIDEADDHKANISYAGSSIALAMGRQTTFGDLAKTLIVSSPKIKGDSEIDSWHDRGDRRVYMVPCIHCGGLQTLRWKDEGQDGVYRLVWDKGDPSSARYLCCHCSKPMVDSDKNVFLAGGRWEPTAEAQDDRVTSYSSNALYLPTGSYSWVDLVRQWESAVLRLKSGDTDEMRSFTNTRLAQSYEPPADAIDPRSLMALVEPSWEFVPAGVQTIVCATDVQDDRLETLTLGVGLGFELYVLSYSVIQTDPIDTGTWAAHDEILNRVWVKADGSKMRCRCAVVDLGGHRTSAVYAYTMRNAKRNVFAIKGKEGKRPIWDKTVRRGAKNTKTKGTFHLIGIDDAKDLLHTILSVRTPGPKYLHIPESVIKQHPDFLDQITAEKREKVKDKSGKEKWLWTKIGGRKNEAWDTLVYGLGAIHCLITSGIPLDKTKPVEIPPEPVEQKSQEPETKMESPLPSPVIKPNTVGGNKPPAVPVRPKAKNWITGGRGNKKGWF